MGGSFASEDIFLQEISRRNIQGTFSGDVVREEQTFDHWTDSRIKGDSAVKL